MSITDCTLVNTRIQFQSLMSVSENIDRLNTIMTKRCSFKLQLYKKLLLANKLQK